MDTLEFFQTILPEEGPYFIAVIDGGKTRHKSCATLEELAITAKRLDATGVATYHACASYQHASVEVPDPKSPGEMKKAWRVPSNWGKAKAFWMDVDCHPDKVAKNQGYADKKAGYAALKLFCHKIKLPVPMVVDSGNGLHCYWPLTKAIGPNSWRRFADRLKTLTQEHGFLADPTRTADFSSILRPVGTTNRKREPKSVVFKAGCDPMDPADFAKAVSLVSVVSSQEILEVPLKSYVGASVNADILSHVPTDISSSAVIAASKCQQMAEMRDTQGDVGYDVWRGVIGVIKHCIEGEPLAVEWSARRKETGHDQYDTDVKYATWSTGPTTCAMFEKNNAPGCMGCAHRGKITSPIMLGRVVPKAEDEEVTVMVDGQPITIEVPAAPDGYSTGKDGTIRYVTDKDDIVHAVKFTEAMFYATHRARRDDNTFGIGLRLHLPDGRVRDFDINTATVASPTDLLKALAAQEVTTSHAKDSAMHMTAYLKDSLNKLMNEAEEINTLTSYGWHYDQRAFLIGDRLYHNDGTVRQVLVGGYAADKLSVFPRPTGSLAKYVEALNAVYAVPRMQPMQYAVASGFGSILTPFCEPLYRGLMLALTGGFSGKGKTSVCHATMYAFGNAKMMTVQSGDTRSGATENARWALLGAYQSIPLILDEMTKIEPEELSRIIYTISGGQEKERMKSTPSGTRFAKQHEWFMSPYATANINFHQRLASSTANSEAEGVRMIEIHIDRYKLPVHETGAVAAAVATMADNSGVAGDVYLRYVTTNLPTIKGMIAQELELLATHLPDSKLRFLRCHAACSLVAIKITNQLGITKFDYDALREFTLRLLSDASAEVEEINTVTSESAFNRMVSDLTPRILQTTEYRDMRDRSGPETPRTLPRDAIVGRYVAGTVNNPTHGGHLYVSRNEIHRWCADNRLEPNFITDYAESKGALLGVDRVVLTRGTSLPTVQQRCYGFDLHKLGGVSLTGPTLVAGAEEAA